MGQHAHLWKIFAKLISEALMSYESL